MGNATPVWWSQMTRTARKEGGERRKKRGERAEEEHEQVGSMPELTHRI